MTSDFTRQACELADQLNDKLVNGRELSHLIDQVNKEILVAEYLDDGQVSSQTGTSPNVYGLREILSLVKRPRHS